MIRKEKVILKLKEDITTVLFDLDGTLVDSMWMWPDIDREFLKERGYDVPDGLKADLDGLSMSEDAVYFKTHFDLKESEEELIDIWNNMALRHYQEDVRLQPGAAEFLDFIKGRGIKAGVVTSNSRVLALAALQSNDVMKYFGTIVTSEDVIHGKPDPEGYLTAAGKLRSTPDQCMVFEDLPAGLIAANSAGMLTAAFDDDYSRPYLDQKSELCDLMINDYRDLIG